MKPEQVEFIFDNYKLIENKLVIFLETIPFSKENEKVWSPELVSLFVETGNLLDSLSRNLLGGSERLNIVDFENDLFKINSLLSINIIIYTYPLRVLTPFENYRTNEDGWWHIYNKLKHNRIDNYEKANLVNIINALGCLFLLLTRYKEEEFSKALHRRQWIKTNIVPEYVHTERNGTNFVPFWCDSSLFGGSDNPTLIPKELEKINPVMTSTKFQRYFGRYNPQ